MEILYSIISDFLTAAGNNDDPRSKLVNAEIIFIYVMACEAYGGNYAKSMKYLYFGGHIKYKLSKSRFSRRLYALKDKITDIFYLLAEFAKNGCYSFQIDSFPVKVCHNIRISRCKLLQGEIFRGKNKSKCEYFYGFKIQVITSESGYIVEFKFSPGSLHDSVAFDIMDFDLPEGSDLFADKAYTAYYFEEILAETCNIKLLPVRKSNSKKEDNKPYINFYRQQKRHIIETFISLVDKLFPKKIHATNIQGFLFKIIGFMFAYNLALLLKYSSAT